jgi:hypothetical protein
MLLRMVLYAATRAAFLDFDNEEEVEEEELEED